MKESSEYKSVTMEMLYYDVLIKIIIPEVELEKYLK
jgi:hypothetical protein